MTADDLRAVGFLVDEVASPGYWEVSGLGKVWIFPAEDHFTAQKLLDLASNADNIAVRTDSKLDMDKLTAALQNWDTLSMQNLSWP